MGTPIDCDTPLVEYGPDCDVCSDLWLPGKTPKFVNIVFKDITVCPHDPPWPEPPNDKPFILEQSIHDSCTWFIAPLEGWLVSWTTREIWTNISLIYKPGDLYYFRDDGLSPCALKHDNTCACDWGSAYGGTCHIWWEPDNIPLELVCHLGFHKGAGNRFDRVQCGIDHQVIRIANKLDKTNCLFYVDNEEFEP